MTAHLPHCQLEEERDPAAVARDLLANPETDEVYFAASKDFYELEDQEHYETIYAAYERAFERIAAQLKASLGDPVFEGSWEDPGYPDYAVGERVVVWQDPEPLYLRLHHEDTEVPILIALARGESGG